MKFTISSNALYGVLQNNFRVIPSKVTMPILDCFLFSLEENSLVVTSSDLETTLVSTVEVLACEADGQIAVPAKRILDSLRELTDQPITFELQDNDVINITWQTGNLQIPGVPASGFPIPTVEEFDVKRVKISSSWLMTAISKTIFAAADSEIRPIMNGIYFDLQVENTCFVATDAQVLAKVLRKGALEGVEEAMSFILPKKPAVVLKNVLVKNSEDVSVIFDDRNIIFGLDDHTLICRSIEGRYPNYNSVIPQNNQNKVIVDRVSFLNAVKRVSVCSNQVSNLIKLTFDDHTISLVAQDVDYSLSAVDSISCNYAGEPITLGYKSTFLTDMLSTINAEEVLMEFTDGARAGLFMPYGSEDEYEQNFVVLIMPLMA